MDDVFNETTGFEIVSKTNLFSYCSTLRIRESVQESCNLTQFRENADIRPVLNFLLDPRERIEKK